ncbi:hypothetical protein J471_4413, partial [Acinetobacter baumannii 1032359]
IDSSIAATQSLNTVLKASKFSLRIVKPAASVQSEP